VTLNEKRLKAIQDARAILDAAKASGRAMSADEVRRYDAFMADADSLATTLNRERAADDADREARYTVPAAIRDGAPGSGDADIVLSKEQRCVDAVRKAGCAYASETARGERLSLGKIVLAMATGKRAGMTDLELRAMSEGTDSAGGFTVPDILGAKFIDRAREASVCFKAGAQTVPMGSDVLNIARLASGPALAWKSENSAITAGDLTLERVQFVAKTCPALVKLSVELAEDSVNVDQIIERELSASLASELDRAALRGDGSSNSPTGIRSQSGVTVENNGAAGTAFAYSQIVNARYAVEKENFAPNARIYHPRVAKSAALLLDTTNQPLRAPAYVESLPEYFTSKIPINLTVGASTDCSEIYVGDFRELLIGLRTSFRLEVTRTAGDAFGNLQIWIRAYLRADVQLAHPKAFCVELGIRP
jgi:HK97 family phage major capsid protein